MRDRRKCQWKNAEIVLEKFLLFVISGFGSLVVLWLFVDKFWGLVKGSRWSHVAIALIGLPACLISLLWVLAASIPCLAIAAVFEFVRSFFSCGDFR